MMGGCVRGLSETENHRPRPVHHCILNFNGAAVAADKVSNITHASVSCDIFIAICPTVNSSTDKPLPGRSAVAKVSDRRLRPPDPSTLLPVVAYSGSDGKEQDCVICLNDVFEAKEMVKVPLDHCYMRPEVGQLPLSPNWTIDVSDVRTVKVSNISLFASQRDIQEFFSFSGDIAYVEMQSESEISQLAYVTFKDSQGADTAMLLTGTTIVDRTVNITPAEYYQLPLEAYRDMQVVKDSSTNEAVKKAEDMVSSMLAKGFVLGKDVLNKAKSFDERHQLLSNASATVASLDYKMGLSEKIGTGTTIVSVKIREVDERFQVIEKTKSALAAAEQTATNAGSAIMSNHYMSTGASWLSNALGMVVKAAGDVSTMTREKLDKAEEERQETLCRKQMGMVSVFAQIHLDESLNGEPPIVPVVSSYEQKLHVI